MMLTLLMAVEEHAHVAHGKSADVLDISNMLPGITALVVFLIAFVVLGTVVWPKITKALDEREAKILGEIKGAEQARRDAESAKQEFERQLAQARQDSAALIAKAKQDAQAVATELRDRNEADLNEMKQRATREIAAAKSQAVAEIHAYASNLATSMAGKILKREINVSDQQRLLDESVQELAAKKN
jgi:F-type H+-transporting ATPase subunit b